MSFKTISNYGHIQEEVRAQIPGEAVVINLDHDGGVALLRHIKHGIDPRETYTSNVRHSYGYTTIGEGRGPASALQKRIAGFVAAMQAKGYYEGVISLVEPGPYHNRLYENYARYARARGWPEERTGAVERVRQQYYAAKRSAA